MYVKEHSRPIFNKYPLLPAIVMGSNLPIIKKKKKNQRKTNKKSPQIICENMKIMQDVLWKFGVLYEELVLKT